MRALSISLLLAALAITSFAQTMPYTPWRTVNGTNYNLKPLYDWRAELLRKAAAGKSTFDAEKQRPHPDWIGANLWEHFTVKQVWAPNLMLVQWQFGHTINDTAEIVIRNYPEQKTVVDGDRLELFAYPVGRYQWTNSFGAVATVPLYDYGIKPSPAR